ncbi:MAG: hypothetical protein HQM08_19150 [Candidatus Riflebacteria bacterium]|nr:hypothetical protein [Candidatus Riflebacteria bacterium]
MASKGLLSGISVKLDEMKENTVILCDSFRGNPYVKQFFSSKDNHISSFFSDNYFNNTNEIVTNRDYKVLLASEKKSKKTFHPAWKFFLIIVSFIWIALGFQICLRSSVFGDILQLSLSTQLSCSILLGLIIITILCALLNEHLSLEKNVT